jgi:hypothetical protein
VALGYASSSTDLDRSGGGEADIDSGLINGDRTENAIVGGIRIEW